MATQGRDFDIGYGKPPRQHQWKRGESGNPRGRPRKRKRSPPVDLLDSFADALLADQRVQMNGRETTIPLFVALVETLVRDSLKGTLRERLLLLGYLDRAGALERLHHRIVEEQDRDREEASDQWAEEMRGVLEGIERDFPGLIESVPCSKP